METADSKPDLLSQLLEESQLPRRFGAHYQAPKGPLESAQPYRVVDALDLEPVADLSNIASGALGTLEELGNDPSSGWINFRWKLSALTHLQDIFDSAVQESKELRTLFQQYYFYYESRVILAECILAGLNGLYVASDALLRPFLEFSLFQNYYYRVTRDSKSYTSIERFFNDRCLLSWGTALKWALLKDDFCRPIRFRINAHLGALSDSVLHAYYSDASVQQH